MFDDDWRESIEIFIEDTQYSRAFNRGLAYVRQNRVLRFDYPADDILEAQVLGSHNNLYTTSLYLNRKEGFFETGCTCPVRTDCKHAIAAAFAVLLQTAELDDSSAIEILNYFDIIPLSNNGKAKCAELSPQAEVFFGFEPSTNAAAATSASPRPQTPWWQQLLEANNLNIRRDHLMKGIALRFPRHNRNWYIGNVVNSLLQIVNPITLLRSFNHAIETIPYTNKDEFKPRDPDLDAFLATPDAFAIEQKIDQELAEQQLFGWIETSPAPADAPESQIEVTWQAIDTGDNIHILAYQVLLTTQRLQANPRNQTSLSNLIREVHAGKRRFVSAEAAFLRWIDHKLKPVTSLKFESPTKQRLFIDNSIDPCHFLVLDPLLWLIEWAQTRILRWNDGGPVRLQVHPARLTMFAPGEQSLQWGIAFPATHDQPETIRPIQQCRIIAEPIISDPYSPPSLNDPQETTQNRFYIRSGDDFYSLDCGQMPYSLLNRLIRNPQVPLERLRDPAMCYSLVNRLWNGRPPENVRAIMQTVPVQPIVECRFDDAANTLSIAVRAVAQDGIEFARSHLGRWEPFRSNNIVPFDSTNVLEALQPANEAESTEKTTQTPENLQNHADPAPLLMLAAMPDPEPLVPVDEWLTIIIPLQPKAITTSNGVPALSWKLYPQHVLPFIRNWARRPPNVTYLGSRGFQNLITPRKLASLNVKVEPSGMNWLEVSIDLEKELQSLNTQEVLQALEASQDQLILLPGGRIYNREDLERYRDEVSGLESIGVDLQAGVQRVHALQLLGGQETGLSIATPLRELNQRAIAMRESFTGLPQAQIPEAMATIIRPYQRAGVDFLAWAAETFGGAILADDMGLGKTLEILTTLETLRAKHLPKNKKKHMPSLVVCPASVAHNWQREAQRFAPELKTVVIERGTGRKALLDHLNEYDLVIKNYALTRRDADTLNEHEWFMICVDEAQAIKNPKAQISETVKTFRAKFRFALTGTPIENRLTDLWSITDFAVPGYLESLDRFEQRTRTRSPESLHRLLRARLRPVLIRRLKSEVAPELPPRVEERRDCEMLPAQRKAYLAELKKTRMLLEKTSDKRVVGKDRIIILAALTRLRQICCDPGLLDLSIEGSGKVEELMDLLTPLMEAGHKVLVFSQFVRMLERLETRLKANNTPTWKLTGQTQKRQELVDAFESDPTPGVFLISLKAGGQGLNLVSASHVVLFDPWWNPAVEAQAIDRTHRIGQDKTVVAFRLVTLGTIEERIIELQDKKRALIKNILEEGAFNRSLTRDDFEYLLSE